MKTKKKRMMRETVRLRRAALAEVVANTVRNRLAVREGESLWAYVERKSAVANGVL